MPELKEQITRHSQEMEQEWTIRYTSNPYLGNYAWKVYSFKICPFFKAIYASIFNPFEDGNVHTHPTT